MKKHFRLSAILFWVAVWQLLAMAVGREIFLASPLRVLSRLIALSTTAEFWRSIVFSLTRIGGGFLCAAGTAVCMAALSSRSDGLRTLLEPLVYAMKSVPVASFVILALIWFGSRNLSVLIAFLMTFPVVYINVLEGIAACDPKLLEMARVFRMRGIRRLRYVYIPMVTPYFASGCRVALGLCWKAGVAAEVIGMPRGSIGEHLQQAKVYLDTPDLFAWTIVVILLSAGFERAFMLLLQGLSRLNGEVGRHE